MPPRKVLLCFSCYPVLKRAAQWLPRSPLTLEPERDLQVEKALVPSPLDPTTHHLSTTLLSSNVQPPSTDHKLMKLRPSYAKMQLPLADLIHFPLVRG